MWTGIPAFFDLTGNNYFEKRRYRYGKGQKISRSHYIHGGDFAQWYTDVVKKLD